MKIEDWHARFKEQAAWSAQSRTFLLDQIHLSTNSKIIEIGSGTGAVLSSFKTPSLDLLVGVDLQNRFLRFNHKINRDQYLVQADGLTTPFTEDYFDLAYCHYLMLWIAEPVGLLAEMKRITRPKGWVACFAEPDYQARIDYPDQFNELGVLQNQSLKRQGVNLTAGRQLATWMESAGLNNIFWGINGAHQAYLPTENLFSLETQVLADDLSLFPVSTNNKKNTIDRIGEPHSQGKILFIPTFYVYGQKE